MAEKKLKPEVRFKGYVDDWEQRKLNEVAEIVGGGTPSTSNPEYWDGDIDWYSPTEIGDHVYANGSVKTITQLGLEKSSAKKLPAGKTVLFTSRAGIGDMAILQHSGATNQGFQSLVLKEGIDTYFIYSMRHLIKKYAKKKASGSTFLEISGKTLGNMPILLPEANEQIQIGRFFKNIDNLITLYQRKYDKLINVKKSMLQNMFPKNGTSLPEIRFKGFIDGWEQHKLGDSIVESTERTSDFKNYPLYSLTIENGVTEKTERYERGFLVSKDTDLFKVVSPQNFVTNPMNLRFGAIGFNRNPYKISVSGYYDVFSLDGNECSEFWNAYLKTSQALKKYDDVATGSLIEKRRVHFSELQRIEFLVPKDVEEKKKIGEYFKNLDSLINLNQCKLEKLKNIKKSMLEKMFP